MLTINETPIISAQITLPNEGAWTALVRTSEEIPLGRIVLADTESGPWSGTVTRTGGAGGVYSCQVVGGAGQVSSAIEGQHFRSLPVSAILAALASPLFESPSPLSDPAVVGSVLSFFSVTSGRLSDALSDLAASAGATWRIGQDGGVWLGSGRIAGPPIDVTPRFTGLALGSGMLTLALDGLEIWPGDVLAELSVKSVEYYFESRATRALIRV